MITLPALIYAWAGALIGGFLLGWALGLHQADQDCLNRDDA